MDLGRGSFDVGMDFRYGVEGNGAEAEALVIVGGGRGG